MAGENNEEGETSMSNGNVDVVVVGGGPAGSAAALYTAQYGLDTVVFDRGKSALSRCAYLENYLGFPWGVDIQSFYELIHEHVEEAGGTVVSDMVLSVDEREAGGFRVETQEGRTVDADRVVAATTYDRDYLEGLDDEDEMFESHQHGDGDVHEHVSLDYVDEEGRAPVDGLYVAGAQVGRGTQALTAAGNGMEVGTAVVVDVRRDQGYWEKVAAHRSWNWPRSTVDHDWDDEEAWNERFRKHRVPADHDIDPDRLREVREKDVKHMKTSYMDRKEAERREERAKRRWAERLDDELLLDVLDDERLREYVQELEEENVAN